MAGDPLFRESRILAKGFSGLGSEKHGHKRALLCAPVGLIVRSTGMPRLTYSKRDAIKQANDLQRLCIESAKLLDADARANSATPEQRAKAGTALSNVVRGWRVLQEAKRILRGDPAPGSFKPERRRPKRKTWWPSEKPLFTMDDPASDSPSEPQVTGAS